MFVAQEIEERCDKNKILELYMNRVFFGSGFYGAEAAARGYFGKRAKELTLSEAAMLAGLLKSPSNLSPWRNRQACVDQRDHVLRRALELEMITQEQYDRTINEDIIVKNRRPTHRESYAQISSRSRWSGSSGAMRR
jgi:penicillin-binding protein 1A